MKNEKLYFKVHIPLLLKEIVESGLDKRMGILKVPINQLRIKLWELAEICKRLNEPELNLWCYEQALFEQEKNSSKIIKNLQKQIKEMEDKK